MTGCRCSACRQSPRLLPLLLLAASFMTLFATPAQPMHCGAAPEIITYGDCPHRLHQLPYQIQTPLSPQPAQPPSSCSGPPERKSYSYCIDGPADPYQPPDSGYQLPVSIQEPLLPAQPPAPGADPLRGRSYGIGIEAGPYSPHYGPSLGQYRYGIQNPAPGAKPSAPVNDDPYRVHVQPGAGPDQGSPLWGPMPIGIERPVGGPAGPGPAGPAPRLTGLTSSIDKLLLPIYCPISTGGQGGGGGGYSGGSGPAGPGCYSGGGGYSGGSGVGGYSGGSGPVGGGGYSACSCL